jgi:hypothetical protein
MSLNVAIEHVEPFFAEIADLDKIASKLKFKKCALFDSDISIPKNINLLMEERNIMLAYLSTILTVLF